MGVRRTLVWKGFQWESDREDLVETIKAIHTTVNGCAGIAETRVVEETGRSRDGVYCRGKLASACYVEFKSNKEMWSFLVANKGKKHQCPHSGRVVFPKVDADKEEEELAKRVSRAYTP